MDNTGIPFSSRDEGVDYIMMSRRIVFSIVRQEMIELQRGVFNFDEVYVVWFSKTLKNWKALLSTTIPDGRYYEVTYNGETDEAYVDTYVKTTNQVVHFEDQQMIADGTPFKTLRTFTIE